MGETWEYLIVEFTASGDYSADSAVLTNYGAQGWEMTAMAAAPDAASSLSYRIFFKRRTA